MIDLLGDGKSILYALYNLIVLKYKLFRVIKNKH